MFGLVSILHKKIILCRRDLHRIRNYMLLGAEDERLKIVASVDAQLQSKWEWKNCVWIVYFALESFLYASAESLNQEGKTSLSLRHEDGIGRIVEDTYTFVGKSLPDWRTFNERRRL